MYARLLALVGMLYVSVSTGQAQLLGTGEVSVYLKAHGDHSPSAMSEMKAEMDKLMRSVGVTLHWKDSVKDLGSTHAELVVLELRGTCDAPRRVPTGPRLQNLTSLASTAVSDGRILPFSWLDCAALSRFIGGSIADLPAPQRDFTYGRAMARLAAHEFYHILGRQSEHAQTGIAKAQFAEVDLLTDHLEFEETVIARDRRSHKVEQIAPGVEIDLGNEK
ncbi:MAG: hypothetical protein ABL967_00340 [Bryobacteraceae bacterium]